MPKKYNILIVDDDMFSLPRFVCDSIKEASMFVGCKPKKIYNLRQRNEPLVINGFEILFLENEDD